MADAEGNHLPQLRCSKSLQTLKLLRDEGIEPEVIEYLKEPPDAAELERIPKKLGLEPYELIRRKEHRALGLPDIDATDELVALGGIFAMVALVQFGAAKRSCPPRACPFPPPIPVSPSRHNGTGCT